MDGLGNVGLKGGMQLLPALQREIPQQDPLLQAALHQATHQLVGLAERHAFGHQIVGHIGGVGEIAGHRLLQTFRAEAEALLEQDRHGLEAVAGGGHRVEQGLLVLLEVLVVGQGQALDHHQQALQVAEYPATLAPHQLRHIRVLLLGHQAAAGGAAVGEGHEAKLLAGPEDHLLAQPAQVHHHQAGGGAELHGEVPVAHRIEAVGVHLLKAQGRGGVAPIDRHRRAG